MDIILRKANINDVEFVAWGVAEAVGLSLEDTALAKQLYNMCSLEDVLYSWKNALIAEIDNKCVGIAIAYDGAEYETLRLKTFEMIKAQCGADFTQQDTETYPREYYIDSLAVILSYRNRGIGRRLLTEVVNYAKNQGFTYAVLAVLPDNKNAKALYESIGFVQEEKVFIFHEDYWRMKKTL